MVGNEVKKMSWRELSCTSILMRVIQFCRHAVVIMLPYLRLSKLHLTIQNLNDSNLPLRPPACHSHMMYGTSSHPESKEPVDER